MEELRWDVELFEGVIKQLGEGGEGLAVHENFTELNLSLMGDEDIVGSDITVSYCLRF